MERIKKIELNITDEYYCNGEDERKGDLSLIVNVYYDITKIICKGHSQTYIGINKLQIEEAVFSALDDKGELLWEKELCENIVFNELKLKEYIEEQVIEELSQEVGQG